MDLSITRRPPRVFIDFDSLSLLDSRDSIEVIKRLGFPVFIVARYENEAHYMGHEFMQDVIVTCDRGLLGDACDIMTSMRPDEGNVSMFPGLMIPIGPAFGTGWHDVIRRLRPMAPVQSLQRELISRA